MQTLRQRICPENNPGQHYKYKSTQNFPQLPYQRILKDPQPIKYALSVLLSHGSDDLICSMQKSPEYKVNAISVPNPAHQESDQQIDVFPERAVPAPSQRNINIIP